MKKLKSSYLGADKLIGRPIRLNQQILSLNNEGFVEVVFLGDVHYGSPQCDLKRFTGWIDYCVKNNIYVYLMGDLIEVGTKTSVGAGVYEQKLNPDEQVDDIIEMLRPLGDKKLIIGNHLGNHEQRIYKDSGVNITKLISKFLGCPYTGSACFNTFKVGNQTYTIYSLHGRTGSRFDGTALLALERISTSFFCDLCAMGHAHKCINSIVLMQKVKNGVVLEHKKHLLITGSFLKYDGGYGQELGLPISKLGSPLVKFYATHHDLVINW